MTLNHKLAATALAVTSLGAAGVANASLTAQTKTTASIEATDDGFTGTLTSKKAKCETGRKVTLVQTKPKSKRGRRIGSDTSNADGEWTVETEKEGRFKAVVKANTSCGAAESGSAASVDD